MQQFCSLFYHQPRTRGLLSGYKQQNECRFSLQVPKCPLEDRPALSDWAVSELWRKIDDLNKACWKEKRALNKAYIRIWASEEQWGHGVHVKDTSTGREERQCMHACICTCIKEWLRLTSREIPVMTSTGSITLPRDLLIFLPWASLTIACKYTCNKNASSSQISRVPPLSPISMCCCIHASSLWFAPPPWKAASRSVWGPSSPCERPRRTGCRGPSPAECQGRTRSGPQSDN